MTLADDVQEVGTETLEPDEPDQPNEPDEPSANPNAELYAALSKLPWLNWGALLMPGIWGPAHGLWVSILFYPLWLFADNCFLAAITQGGIAIPLAVVVFLGTAAFTIFFARTAQAFAYRRSVDSITINTYRRRERNWAITMAIVATALIATATWYNLTVVIPQGN